MDQPIRDATEVQDIQERTFHFACRVVRLHMHLIRCSQTHRELAGQVLRSASSIGANLEEADGAQSRADFISKCNIALKEARETHYWLRLFQACDLVSVKRLSLLTEEANAIVAILTAIVKKARSKQAADGS